MIRTSWIKSYDFSVERIDCVGFIGVDAILSNSSNQTCDEIYMVKNNFISKNEDVVAISLKFFMACEDKSVHKNQVKLEFSHSDVRSFQNNYHNLPIIKNITFVVGCCLVVILRKGEWNELTRYPKDCGKNRLNSRTNSLQHGENDVY